MPTSPGLLLQATLHGVWDRLRAAVPELPAARIIVASTPANTDHSQERWAWDEDQPHTVSGVIVGSEALQSGPDAVLTAVLHEAAHVLCWVRKVNDTSMRGAYHNATYLAAAQEVGLTWPDGRPRSSRGYADPELSLKARVEFDGFLNTICDTLPKALPHIVVPDAPRPRRTDRVPMTCQCDEPRKIWVARTTAARGPIMCGICKQDFAAE